MLMRHSGWGLPLSKWLPVSFCLNCISIMNNNYASFSRPFMWILSAFQFGMRTTYLFKSFSERKRGQKAINSLPSSSPYKHNSALEIMEVKTRELSFHGKFILIQFRFKVLFLLFCMFLFFFQSPVFLPQFICNRSPVFRIRMTFAEEMSNAFRRLQIRGCSAGLVHHPHQGLRIFQHGTGP